MRRIGWTHAAMGVGIAAVAALCTLWASSRWYSTAVWRGFVLSRPQGPSTRGFSVTRRISVTAQSGLLMFVSIDATTPRPLPATYGAQAFPAPARRWKWWGFYFRWQTGSCIVRIPLWLPILLAAAATAWLWRLNRRPRLGRCPRCGYDLTATAPDSPCPECGSDQASAA